jgi:gamma-D-glutamyl-L-lysine dipeptidyl-peptidase
MYFSAMERAFVHLAVIPGRVKPSDEAEMATQLLYGELVEILEHQKQWRKIKSFADDYTSWVDSKQLTSLDMEPLVWRKDVIRTTSSLSDIKTKKPHLLPGGSFIHSSIGDFSYSEPSEPNTIREIAMQYIGAPYLWGGKSVLGIDCSGFMQVVMSGVGQWLPRDAYQQAEVGETVSFVSEAKEGDLAFFDNGEGKIIHVGIILEESNELNIIHASGEVRIDVLDHQGIFRRDTNSYSHNLRIIKRI